MMIPRRTILALLFSLVLLAGAAQAQPAAVAANSTAVLNCPYPAVSMYVVPNGSGTTFTQCYAQGGIPTSASIEVTVRDLNFLPIANFSNREVRLNQVGSSMQWCSNVGFPPPQHGPNCADMDTDQNGQTTFTLNYYGGGSEQAGTQVWVLEGSGNYAAMPGVLPVSWNSPDINGDGWVNLSDITEFAQDLHGPPSYRSDFNWDGVVNLTDIIMFGYGINAGCP